MVTGTGVIDTGGTVAGAIANHNEGRRQGPAAGDLRKEPAPS